MKGSGARMYSWISVMPSTESSNASLRRAPPARRRLEKPHAQALAGAVVLGDEGAASSVARRRRCSRPTAAIVRGVRMPYCSSAAYCATLLISRCSARLLLTTRRPCDSSHASTPPVSSGRSDGRAYATTRSCGCRTRLRAAPPRDRSRPRSGTTLRTGGPARRTPRAAARPRRRFRG